MIHDRTRCTFWLPSKKLNQNHKAYHEVIYVTMHNHNLFVFESPFKNIAGLLNALEGIHAQRALIRLLVESFGCS